MDSKEIKIIYEDEDILVIDKPSGLTVHGDGKRDEDTLTDWLIKSYPEIKNVGEQAIYDGKVIARPGIVHRLDKDTSGVMVIAKNQKAYEYLKEQFKERLIQKTYRAFVYGNIKSDTGVIDKPIGRHPKKFKEWLAGGDARGQMREAITEYKVLSRGKDESGESFTYIELYPKTGRTHQLRVHLKSINNSIMCDPIYASKRPCLLGFSRLALHSFRLEIKMPSGDRKVFNAPSPEDFEGAIAHKANL